jgi:hypothetical protein
MATVKIISGHTNPGGSTVANINLCNLLNSRGVDTTFYGPHTWHLGQSKSDSTRNFKFNPNDILIVHYLVMPARPPVCKRLVLSCHETTLYPVARIPPFWDIIHFVSAAQRVWQGVHGVVIPNRISPLTHRKTSTGIAGVIGSIDRNKQTHISIERALKDGYDKVLLYGELVDRDFYTTHVKSYVDSGKAVLKGFKNDKQAIYDSVDIVYHSSANETFNLIRAECIATGTTYRGTDSADPDVALYSDDMIFSAWSSLLAL